jgi:hypothetical protein
MHDSITEDRVSLALQALGETAEDVASMLLAGGWLGLRNDAGACPVARYLSTVMTNADGAAVGSDEATVFQVYGPDIEVDLTPAVAAFVLSFDDGTFPDLIAQDCDANGDVIEDQ